MNGNYRIENKNIETPADEIQEYTKQKKHELFQRKSGQKKNVE